MRYFLMFFVFLFMACGPSELEKKEAALIEDVHRLHDVETMPKLGYLETLKGELDQMDGLQDSIKFSRKKDLNNAYDAMMGWMNQFNWPSDKTPIENRIEYYDAEVQKLEVMKTIMLSAIDSAEVTLGK